MQENGGDRKEHDEHIGVNVTKRITNLSKNNMFPPLTTFHFIDLKRRR